MQIELTKKVIPHDFQIHHIPPLTIYHHFCLSFTDFSLFLNASMNLWTCVICLTCWCPYVPVVLSDLQTEATTHSISLHRLRLCALSVLCNHCKTTHLVVCGANASMGISKSKNKLRFCDCNANKYYLKMEFISKGLRLKTEERLWRKDMCVCMKASSLLLLSALFLTLCRRRSQKLYGLVWDVPDRGGFRGQSVDMLQIVRVEMVGQSFLSCQSKNEWAVCAL